MEVWQQTLFSTLGAIGGTTIVLGALAKFLGNIWVERILSSEKAERDKEIALLKVEQEKEMALLKAELSLQIERRRWPLVREDALSAEYRSAVEKVVLPMMSAIHEMCWLTWSVDDVPDLINLERVTAYDAEMHSLLARVSGYLALVAAHDQTTFDELRGHVDDIYTLDAKIGTCAHLLVKARKSGNDTRVSRLLRDLEELHQRAWKKETEIASDVAGIIATVVDQRAELVLAGAAKTGDHANGE